MVKAGDIIKIDCDCTYGKCRFKEFGGICVLVDLQQYGFDKQIRSPSCKIIAFKNNKIVHEKIPLACLRKII